MMKCPKCDESELSPRVMRGVEVDWCAECHGIWFDESELARLIESDPEELRRLSGGVDTGRDGVRGDCPRDGTALLRVFSVRNRRLVLDTCPECRGIWLDGGEAVRLGV